MPPKKGKAKATPVPATVTTNRGKGIETTAAAARPRRESTNVVAAPVNEVKTPAKKRGRPTKAAVEEPVEDAEPPRKRGRPAKAAVEEAVAEPPKKRGRPAKAAIEESAEAVEPLKKRGRPAKATAEEPVEDVEPPKKRGRPAKAAPEEAVAELPNKRTRKAKVDEDEPAAAATPPPNKRGRPAKTKAEMAPAVVDDEQAAPRKRGRPPFGGQTTKLDTADGDAAKQLEDELIDNADAVQEPAPAAPKPKVAAAKNGKARKTKKAADDVEDDVDAEHAQDSNSSGKQYWLMKAEQEDREEKAIDGSTVNTKFTIDDLRAKTVPELWDGMFDKSNLLLCIDTNITQASAT